MGWFYKRGGMKEAWSLGSLGGGTWREWHGAWSMEHGALSMVACPVGRHGMAWYGQLYSE